MLEHLALSSWSSDQSIHIRNAHKGEGVDVRTKLTDVKFRMKLVTTIFYKPLVLKEF